ncbi:MAG: 4-aminobutyrate aminotransferase / (S)-3-amino-2-methylpropionate transaminase / 5-aminovalerate [Bryobacterales bacterium]|jgi:4-aminobutyrate aminotransferase/diaminobutyrate-pyruvate transaminase/4-aminobutyrate aminotransferase/(S)-3-amino-2-methylpropionate transaminase|nr:4-aminobutyrate aminotransferase / (S)-3-amino-2-methylpropionate transaminase / 5-aminovalerate [Bryobacterales bacterium]
MAREYSITPRRVSRIETPFRRIVTDFPVPQSVPVLTKLQAYEPVAMRGQPPVIWDHAEGFQVYDPWGNKWIDWTSGVLIANAGHGRQEIVDAIVQQASSKLLTNYCFPSEIRMRMVETLAAMLPAPLKKIFLLTTGSETVECAIKLCRTHGMRVGGQSKHVIVSFDKSFHGRTLGSQQAGGIPGLKDWIVNLDPGFAQVPFPDGFRTNDNTFAGFEQALRQLDVRPGDVAGVMLETYQGGSAAFAPPAYMQALRQWCTEHNALLVCDEVQAGFGRTGKLWGFEHYGIVPDLALFGKGLSSSLPISAVAGRADAMDMHPAGSMTSTHTGNPVCCAAALASIELVVKEKLTENARKVGAVLHDRLHELQSRFPQIGRVDGKGLVAGVACVRPGTQEPDGDLAWEVVERCIENGVLMFSPVGFGGATVKIAPPLVINEAAILEGISVLQEVFSEAVNKRTAVA